MTGRNTHRADEAIPEAVYQALDEQNARLDAMTVNHHQVAQQIAELTLSMGQLRREIPSLMAAGIMQAVSDPNLWKAAGDAMSRQAHTAAGGWLFGGLKAAATRLMWIVVIASGLYALGGPTAVVAFFKSQQP